MFAGLAALVALSAAACGGGGGSQPANGGSGDIAANPSAEAPITIKMYLPPT